MYQLCINSQLTSPDAGGLGYAFITYYAAKPDTKVFGLVRKPQDTEARLAKDGIKNVTLLKADITDFNALEAAAVIVSKETGGHLDLLINNAGLVGGSGNNEYKNLPDFSSPEELERDLKDSFNVNVVGVAHTINAFLPLIRKGQGKKVVSLSTGLADDSFSKRYSIGFTGPYAISKAALNTLVSKFHIALGPSEGILFFAISPGLVDTSEGKPMSEEAIEGAKGMGAAFVESVYRCIVPYMCLKR